MEKDSTMDAANEVEEVEDCKRDGWFSSFRGSENRACPASSKCEETRDFGGAKEQKGRIMKLIVTGE